MKAPEEHDDLWQLLGKAKKPAVSPLFARNVLREIRQSQPEREGLFYWLRLRWRVVSLGGAAVVLLAVNAAMLSTSHNTPMVAQATTQSASATKPDDTEVITHLDELVAYEENSVWLEDSSQ
jgi:anti-sigma-K factor RskA